MAIEDIIQRSTDLPDHKLVGYTEIGVPIFKRTLHCLLLQEKTLHVIEEYLLRLSEHYLSLEEITMLLGLDPQLVEASWFNLISMGFIDPLKKEISDSGKIYLQDNKIDSYDKMDIHVCIDGLTGQIKADRNWISSQNIRELGIPVVDPYIETPDKEELINYSEVNSILHAQHQNDDDENSTGKLLEILKITNKKTQFKRISVLIYTDPINNVRIMAYDGNEHKQNYEAPLVGLDERGFSIYKLNESLYFENYSDEKYKSLYKNGKEIIGPSNLHNCMYEWIDEVKSKVEIILPLVELFTPTDKLISKLTLLLKKKVRVNFVISGREFASALQKKQYEKLLELRTKNESLLTINNIAEYTNKCVILDAKRGLISKLIQHNTGLVTSKLGMTEEGFLLEQQTEVQDASNLFFENKAEISFDPLITKKELERKLKSIADMVVFIDEYLITINGKGWIGGGVIPSLQRMLSVPVAINEESFENFANTLTQSLIEVLNKGKGNSYFFDEFKRYFPGIQRVLHKIRVYRNSVHHLKLEEQVKKNYYIFLDEDLNGSLPIFLRQGYHILQTKLVNELNNALYDEVNKIKLEQFT